MNSSLSNVTIVLVHGAWADGSCWNNVILPLRRAGFAVTCAPIPLTSLTDDAAALRHVIGRANSPVVLVGHAYAGAVDLPPRSVRLVLQIYPVAGAVAKWETAKPFSKQAEPASFP
jgi:hypothetical protein